MAEGTGSLFHASDGWFVPSELTRGPWRPDTMHGGPPSALVAWAVEQLAEAGEQVARVTIDLEAPVPIEPLRVATSRRQASRRVAHLTVELHTAGGRVCTAAVLLLRADPLPEPTWRPPWDDAVPGPERRVDLGPGFHGAGVTYHRDAVEHRIVHGAIGEPGPCVSWVSLTTPLVDGGAASPLCNLLACADFGSAIAQPFAADSGTALINVDVSLALSRRPVGEWFRLDSIDLIGDGGAGLAVTHLADLHGPLGILHQTQIGRRL